MNNQSLLRTWSAIMCLAVIGTFASSAQAECPSPVYSHNIKGGLEASAAGVPNYAQAQFPGGNDCGPTAAAMLLGYYDANGWPCMVPGSGPYYDGATPQGVKDLVADLQQEMPYSEDFGTPPSNGLDYNGKAITRVAHWQDPGAGWTYDEDEIISTNDIISHIDADRPVLLCIRAFGGDYTWIDDTSNAIGGSVEWHWMTILGYEKHKEYAEILGDCVDWADDDEFYFIMRSGWRNGSDSRMRYHMGFWDDLYTVEIWPNGSPSCTDPQDEDGDGVATTTPVAGMTGGNDCDDSDPDVKPGQPEYCDNIDNNCNGMIDEGGPLPPAPGGPDADGDNIGDNCDICPNAYDPDQLDSDFDGLGDACDPDDDNDGCDDEDDDKPLQSYSEIGTEYWPNCQPSSGAKMGFDGVDSDGDGLLNCEDGDDDDDGVLDGDDVCPTVDGDVCHFAGHTCPFMPLYDICLRGGCNLLLSFGDTINPDPTRTRTVPVEVVNDVMYLARGAHDDVMDLFDGRMQSLELTLVTPRAEYALGTFSGRETSVRGWVGQTVAVKVTHNALVVEAVQAVGAQAR